jgi:hypothetical protein
MNFPIKIILENEMLYFIAFQLALEWAIKIVQ